MSKFISKQSVASWYALTHACINSLSQILVNEEVWLSIVSKILIISLAIMIARKKYETVKEEK